MTLEQPNPYTPPSNQAGMAPGDTIDPVLVKKLETIVKDAGQFWLAILICIFCSGLGSLIIGPWYLVRLMQWNSLARAEPRLLVPQPLPGSIAQRFQSAKTKLIIGIVFGAVAFVLVVGSVLVMVASARS